MVVGMAGAQLIPRLVLACWWMGWVCRLQGYGFSGAANCPLVGEAGPEARNGSVVGGARYSGDGPYSLMDGAGSHGLWLQGPGCLRSSACTLVCRAWSWAIEWAGLYPGEAVGLGVLKQPVWQRAGDSLMLYRYFILSFSWVIVHCSIYFFLSLLCCSLKYSWFFKTCLLLTTFIILFSACRILGVQQPTLIFVFIFFQFFSEPQAQNVHGLQRIIHRPWNLTEFAHLNFEETEIQRGHIAICIRIWSCLIIKPKLFSFYHSTFFGVMGYVVCSLIKGNI